jgi:hypothetical protein
VGQSTHAPRAASTTIPAPTAQRARTFEAYQPPGGGDHPVVIGDAHLPPGSDRFSRIFSKHRAFVFSAADWISTDQSSG